MNHTQKLQAAQLMMEKEAGMKALLGGAKKVLPFMGQAFKGVPEQVGIARAAGGAKGVLGAGWKSITGGGAGIRNTIGGWNNRRRAMGLTRKMKDLRGQYALTDNPALRTTLTGKMDDLGVQARKYLKMDDAPSLGNMDDISRLGAVGRLQKNMGVKTMKANPFGTAALTAGGMYGGAQGIGYGAGLATGDRSGERQFQDMSQMDTLSRIQYLLNPEQFIQNQGQRWDESGKQPSVLNWAMSGIGGFRSGQRQIQDVMDNRALQTMGQAPWYQRLGYTVAPQTAIDRVRQGMGR